MKPILSTRDAFQSILNVSLPLVAGLATTTVMEFTDRVFLGGYSLDALAAATPGGILALLLTSVFYGTAGYVSVFTAQYTGSGQPGRVGRLLWQGVYLALASVLFLGLVVPGLGNVFALVGHPPHIQAMELEYCAILCLGGGVNVLGGVFSAFFSGQGRTRLVLAANIAGMVVNIPLDYALINGTWFFPELGIRGAAMATVLGWAVVAVILGVKTMSRKNELRFKVRSDRGFSLLLFTRLLRFGLPTGIEFFLDIFAFTAFVFLVGTLGTRELAATNMALSINSLAFLPLVGFSMGTGILTGQAMGMSRPDTVGVILKCTLGVVFAYLSVLGLLFLCMPDLFIHLFKPVDMSFAEFAPVAELGRILLKFVTGYLFFDGLTYVFCGVLKGAGDTRFVMLSHAGAALVCMLLPLWIVKEFNLGLYAAWSCACAYVVSLSIVSWFRFRQGAWREMRVVEVRE